MMVADVATEQGSVVTISLEPGQRKEAPFGEHCVNNLAAVTLAEDEAVPLRVLWCCRIDFEHRSIQDRKDIGDGEAAADMGGICVVRHSQRVAPYFPCQLGGDL